LGVEVELVAGEVGRSTRLAARASTAVTHAAGGSVPAPSSFGDAEPDHGHEPGNEHAFALARPDLRDPVVSAERQLLQAVLQFPSLIDPVAFDAIAADSFSAPAHRAVLDAIRVAGGIEAAKAPGQWTDRVSEAAALTVRPLVSELAVAPVPARFDSQTGLPERRYVDELLVRIQEVSLTRRIGDAISAMRRVPPDDSANSRELGVHLQSLQRELATLRSTLG
jgi:DNA primase